MVFLQVAHQYRLNPLIRELYAFVGKGGGIVPIVPIDGWANIINSNPHYDGIEFEDRWVEPGNGKAPELVSVTCIIYRKDRSHPTKITEYMNECFQPGKDPWVKWPARMLRHKSMIQAARIAFSLAGIYDPDEAERILESEERREQVVITRPQPLTFDEPATNGRVIEAEPVKESTAPSAGSPTEHSGVVVGAGASVAAGAPAPVETVSGVFSPPKGTAVPQEECSQCHHFYPRPVSAHHTHEECVANKKLAEPQGVAVSPDAPKPATSKPPGPYVPQAGPAGVPKLSKLFAIAAGAGIKVTKNSRDDELHKKLKELWNIDSVTEIPVAIFGEVCEVIGKKIATK
jgi:phage recombination protein Bet